MTEAQITAAGIIVLLLVAWPSTRVVGKVAFGIAAFALGLGLAVASLHLVLNRLDAVPLTNTMRVAHTSASLLQKRLERPTKHVLIIDGSSTSCRGIDPDRLRRRLARMGHRVTVILVAQPGANYFERHVMHQRIALEALQKHDSNWEDINWVMMAEIYLTYDKYPLAQLDPNAYTDRAYAYLTPKNAFDAWRATRLWDGQDLPDVFDEWLIASHALASGFVVGGAHRYVALDSLQPRKSYLPLRRKKRGVEFRRLDGKLGKKAPEKRNWPQEFRRVRLDELYSPWIDRWAYHALPTVGKAHRRYARAFCKQTDEPCFAANDKHLLSKLNRSSMWYDMNHLTRRGAHVYTDWLAQKLAESGVFDR